MTTSEALEIWLAEDTDLVLRQRTEGVTERNAVGRPDTSNRAGGDPQPQAGVNPDWTVTSMAAVADAVDAEYQSSW